ncbi:MAG: hypothetical protein IT342_07295 [Candidatus Melainabacteria bacterium]|nr:hypothetical protein [Candidatus Melainabacteria bacterium]
MSRPLLFGIFALSLAFRLWFNFAFLQVNIAGAADGSEYLRLADALNQFFSQKSELSVLSGFKQAGPVFPLFILICQKAGSLFGNFPAWMPPVFGQCILSAVADVFLCLTAKLFWGGNAALCCALFAILYPASLINSGRLYAESFSTSISIMVLYLMCRGFVGEKRKGLQFFALGFGLATLQLARSVMILLSFLALPLTFFQERKAGAVKSLAWLLLAMSLVMVPWLFAQKSIFNKASLVVDRVGNYNLFVGTNPDISGWLSYPYPDGTGVEKRSAISVLADNVRRSPSRFAKLMLDKPYRLAKFPWNDFRTEAGLFSYTLQVAFHQLLLVLCAVGICLALVRNDDGSTPSEAIFKGRLLLFLYFASHVIYFCFITVPRYNMTATPVLILFAAAGATAIVSLFRKNAKSGAILSTALLLFFAAARLNEIGLLYQFMGNPFVALTVFCLLKGLCASIFFILLWKLFPKPPRRRVPALSVHCGLAFLAVLLVVYPARANGRAFEWECRLDRKGDKITQQISLSKDDLETLKNQQLYVLIDTDGARDFVENGQAKANGEVLKGPLIPGIALSQDFSAEKQMNKDQIYFECEWIYDCMTHAAGIASGDIRQWFVMAVPPAAVQKVVTSGLLTVDIENITGAHSFKIFGNYLKRGMYPSILSSSWEKAFYGVESDRGFTDSRYDVKLDLTRHTSASFASRNGSSETDLSPTPGLQSGSFNLLLTGAKSEPIQSKQATDQDVVMSAPLPLKVSIPAGGTRMFSPGINSRLPASANEVWLFRLRGKSFASKKNIGVEPKVNVLVTDESGRTLVYPSRWLPRMLPNQSSAVAFDYCFPMMPSLLKEKIASVQILLSRTDSDPDAGSKVEIEDFCFDILPVSNNPVSSKNRLY